MDEIVIENNWRAPIYFSSPPYAESPLNLREHAVHTGLLYKLEREPDQSLTDADTGYDLYMNHYLFLGYDTPEVYRDDNATGIYLGVGMTAQRIFDRLLALGDRERGEALMQRLNEVLPEFAQAYLNLAELYSRDGDTAKMLQILQRADDTLTAFLASNKKNFYYRADLGYFKTLIGRRTNDQSMIEEGIDLIMEAFSNNRNNNYVFRKAVAALTQEGQYLEAQRVATQFVNYKKNLNDPIAQQLLGRRPPGT